MGKEDMKPTKESKNKKEIKIPSLLFNLLTPEEKRKIFLKKEIKLIKIKKEE